MSNNKIIQYSLFTILLAEETDCDSLRAFILRVGDNNNIRYEKGNINLRTVGTIILP